MNINFRRFLALFFIILFFLLLPNVLNYVRGYRFDAQKNQMVRTGGIAIDSNPRNASVYLNGNHEEPNFFEKLFIPLKSVFGLRKMGGTTPAIFQSLVPDEYEVEITKKDYQPWSKKINVYAEQVTFLENINLFLDEPETENLLTKNITSAKFSPDKQKIAYLDNNLKLNIFNLTNNKNYQINSLNNINTYSWSPTNDKLLIENNNKKLILDWQNENLIDLTKISQNNFNLTMLSWDHQSSDYLYALNDDEIYRLNLAQQNFELYHQFAYQDESTIVDYWINEGQFWAIQNSGDQAEFKKFTAQLSPKAETSQTLTYLPASDNYQIADIENNFTVITNDDVSNNIYVIDNQNNNPDQALMAKFFAVDFSWNKSKNRLLYRDNFEIGIISLNRDNKNTPSHQEVLSRYGQQVSQVNWSDDENYIIFGLEKAIYALELDNRDKRNIYTLTQPQNILNLSFDGLENIYLVGQVDDRAGIFEVKIQ